MAQTANNPRYPDLYYLLAMPLLLVILFAASPIILRFKIYLMDDETI